ncbi:hypothetical protein C8F01DRAFT_1136778 [Mycena amicta]|nr:hypothetical protein C8F01DRAFT_1136778 [Mycena amicta]
MSREHWKIIMARTFALFAPCCSEELYVVGIRKRSQTNGSWTSSGLAYGEGERGDFEFRPREIYLSATSSESLSLSISMASGTLLNGVVYWMPIEESRTRTSRKPSPLPRSSLATKPLATRMSLRRCRRDGNSPSPWGILRRTNGTSKRQLDIMAGVFCYGSVRVYQRKTSRTSGSPPHLPKEAPLKAKFTRINERLSIAAATYRRLVKDPNVPPVVIARGNGRISDSTG